MDKISYSDAGRYVMKITGDNWNYKDILHDTWIKYYERTGKNLLEEHKGFVMRAIKFTIWNRVRDSKKMPTEEYHEVPSMVFDPLMMYQTQEFYTNLYDLVDQYKGNISPFLLKKIIKLADEGYSFYPEIANMLQFSQQKLQYHKEKIRTIIKTMLVDSPFSGNKLKVKKVTRSEVEKHPEKYEDYVYDTDRWADCNEYYQQLVHKEKDEGLLIVESKRKDL